MAKDSHEKSYLNWGPMWGGIANLHEIGRNRTSDDRRYSYQSMQAMNMRFWIVVKLFNCYNH